MAGDVGGSTDLRAMIDSCLPLPGEQERDWVLWVELWLRAVRHPELRPTAAKLYARMHEWFADAIEPWATTARATPARSPTGCWR